MGKDMGKESCVRLQCTRLRCRVGEIGARRTEREGLAPWLGRRAARSWRLGGIAALLPRAEGVAGMADEWAFWREGCRGLSH